MSSGERIPVAQEAYQHPPSLLLVEDSGADIRLTREALRRTGLSDHLDVVTDGEAALAFLRRQPPYADSRRPSLILLDLNLPRVDGREVLAEIKQDPDLLTIPVVVLTTSGIRADVRRAYQHHANAYVVKPMLFEDFERVLVALGRFWFDTVTLSDKDVGHEPAERETP